MGAKKPPSWNNVQTSNLEKYNPYSYNQLQGINLAGPNQQNAVYTPDYASTMKNTISGISNNQYQPSKLADSLTQNYTNFLTDKINKNEFGITAAEKSGLENKIVSNVNNQTNQQINNMQDRLSATGIGGGLAEKMMNNISAQSRDTISKNLTDVNTQAAQMRRTDEAQTYSELQNLSNTIDARADKSFDKTQQNLLTQYELMKDWDTDTFNKNFATLQQNNQNRLTQYQTELDALMKNNQITQEERNFMVNLQGMNNQIEELLFNQRYQNQSAKYNADAARTQASNAFTSSLINAGLGLTGATIGAAGQAGGFSNLFSSSPQYLLPSNTIK